MFVTDLEIDQDRLAALCDEYGIVRLEVFGSFATGEASDTSDVDLLVTFREGVSLGLRYLDLRSGLAEILGREVDLHERTSVEASANKYFRKYALEHVQQLYAA